MTRGDWRVISKVFVLTSLFVFFSYGFFGILSAMWGPTRHPDRLSSMYLYRWEHVGRSIATDLEREADRLEYERRREEAVYPLPDPSAPPGVWNNHPGPRTDLEEALQDQGAWLIIRSGPGLPGWWYGSNAPKGACIPGSLYTRTDAAGLYVCGPKGWAAK